MDRATLKRRSGIFAVGSIIAAIPAIITSWTGYVKAKAEATQKANVGYVTIREDVEKLKTAFSEKVKADDEWKRLMLHLVSTHMGGRETSRPQRERDDVQKLNNAPILKAMPIIPLPADLSKAVEKVEKGS